MEGSWASIIWYSPWMVRCVIRGEELMRGKGMSNKGVTESVILDMLILCGLYRVYPSFLYLCAILLLCTISSAFSSICNNNT